MQFWTILFITLSGTFALLNIAIKLLQQQHRVFSVPTQFASYYDAEKYRTSQYIAHIETWGDIAGSILGSSIIIYGLYFGWFGQMYVFLGTYLSSGVMHNTGMLICYFLVMLIPAIPIKNIASTFIKKYQTEQKPSTPISKLIKAYTIAALIVIILSYITFFILIHLSAYAWLVLLVVLFVLRKQFRNYISSRIAKGFFINADKPGLMYIQQTAQPISTYLSTRPEKLEKIQQFVTQSLHLSLDQVKVYTTENEKASITGYYYMDTIYLESRLLEDEFDEDELFAVIAHEAAHHSEPVRLTHYTFFFVFLFFIFGLHYANGMQAWSEALGFSVGNAPALNLIAFLWIFSKVKLMMNIIERRQMRQNEYRADKLAVQATNREAISTFLKKTYGHNLTPVSEHPWQEFVHGTHPSLTKRLKYIAHIPAEEIMLARLLQQLRKQT